VTAIVEALALTLLCVATWLIEKMPHDDVASSAWLCCGIICPWGDLNDLTLHRRDDSVPKGIDLG
jgi:hypothetical protein